MSHCHSPFPLQWGAAANIVYCPAVALAKVAILIFYLRLNPQKTFRYSVFAVLFITVGYMIALCFALFFQCRPVAKVWNPLLEGHCVNAKDLYLWNTILNVITDFLVILVPIPMLRTLQVGTRQKWVIGLLFGIGSLYVLQLSATLLDPPPLSFPFLIHSPTIEASDMSFNTNPNLYRPLLVPYTKFCPRKTPGPASSR